MKKTDIKRLEKAVEHYMKIEDLLERTYDSTYLGDEEYVSGIGAAQVTTTRLVGSMLKDAIASRKFIEGKIRVLSGERP